MGARSGSGGGQSSGAKGSITGFEKLRQSEKVGNLAQANYVVFYKQNGKKGEQMEQFATKKGADLFQKAVKNKNGVEWSKGVAKKVDAQTKSTIDATKQKNATRRQFNKMLSSGELSKKYPNGVPLNITLNEAMS